MGVSLGGNIALKLAGETREHPVSGLARVGAMAPPIDLEACVALLRRPANRLYERLFLRDLIREAEQRQRHFPDLPPLRWARRMTLPLFDDLYTAPRHGFADSTDYYRKASSQSFVPHIEVPTLIMTAADDPVVAIEPFLALKAPSHVTIRVHRHGGHLGFLGWDGRGGFRWAERRLVEWAVEKR
jgi:predicted alpha/beta-fold hydrolase